MRLRSTFLDLLVLTVLASACSEPESTDYGPPPTCLAGEEGLGHWEYLPTPFDETGLLDEDPERAEPITSSSGTMVWTGSEVLYWAGDKGVSFDPQTKQWSQLPTEMSPSSRASAISVWTGTHWIVWGGEWWPDPWDGTAAPRNDGSIYDPVSRAWSTLPTEGAPQSAVMQRGAVTRREREAAIWTGTEMLFWTVGKNDAGDCAHQGALYNPETQSWRSMSFEGSPLGNSWAVLTDEPQYCPTSRRGPLIWTGNELIVWSTDFADRSLAHVGVYTPSTDTWRPVDVPQGILPRWGAYAAWTGSEVLVWGGSVQSGGNIKGVVTGGFYNPVINEWRTMSAAHAPDGQSAGSQSLWTGRELLAPAVEGGCPVGARYDLATDSWSAMARSASEFNDRNAPTMVWAGTAAVLWGGHGHYVSFNDGALYYP